MSEIKEKSVVLVSSASKQISVQGEDSTIIYGSGASKFGNGVILA